MIDPSASALLNALRNFAAAQISPLGLDGIIDFIDANMTAGNLYRIGSNGPSSQVLLYEGFIKVNGTDVHAGSIADDISKRNSNIVSLDNTKMGQFAKALDFISSDKVTSYDSIIRELFGENANVDDAKLDLQRYLTKTGDGLFDKASLKLVQTHGGEIKVLGAPIEADTAGTRIEKTLHRVELPEAISSGRYDKILGIAVDDLIKNATAEAHSGPGTTGFKIALGATVMDMSGDAIRELDGVKLKLGAADARELR
jgi:hypothetical protein